MSCSSTISWNISLSLSPVSFQAVGPGPSVANPGNAKRLMKFLACFKIHSFSTFAKFMPNYAWKTLRCKNSNFSVILNPKIAIIRKLDPVRARKNHAFCYKMGTYLFYFIIWTEIMFSNTYLADIKILWLDILKIALLGAILWFWFWHDARSIWLLFHIIIEISCQMVTAYGDSVV